MADARGRVAPERLRVAELLAEAEAAERAAVDEREAAETARADAERQRVQSQERESELEAEIAKVRASAEQEREAAAAAAQRDLAEARVELDALRKEIRAARRRQKETRRAPEAERERDRRLGAASVRAARAEEKLRGFDEPLPLLAPLAVGDPVEEPALGVRGTIAAIDGDEAEVVGSGGHRVRIGLARLRPDAHGGRRRGPGAGGARARGRARGRLGRARRARADRTGGA